MRPFPPLTPAAGGRPDGSSTQFPATVQQALPAGPETQPADSDLFAADDAPGSAGAGPADVAARPTLSHIGRYALKSRLGDGGLGTVHEAWDPLLSRTVAVKTLQFDLDPGARAALDGSILEEARTAAALAHPGIVTIFDAGLSAHGVYIAMERLHGQDLRRALAGGWRPSAGAAARLVRRVADALAYAHARGVVHCDVKPANIFLTTRGKPKLLDFGIARVAQRPPASAAAAAAAAEAVAGSPHYLAPELLSGGAVDARSDVYALGVVLHELLTGRKAFDGTSLEEIAARVREGRPVPAAAVRPGLPPALAAIAARAMARDPADRYASAADLAQALRGWLAERDALRAESRAGQAGPARARAPARPPVIAAASATPARRLAGLAAGARAWLAALRSRGA